MLVKGGPRDWHIMITVLKSTLLAITFTCKWTQYDNTNLIFVTNEALDMIMMEGKRDHRSRKILLNMSPCPHAMDKLTLPRNVPCFLACNWSMRYPKTLFSTAHPCPWVVLVCRTAQCWMSYKKAVMTQQLNDILVRYAVFSTRSFICCCLCHLAIEILLPGHPNRNQLDCIPLATLVSNDIVIHSLGWWKD